MATESLDNMGISSFSLINESNVSHAKSEECKLTPDIIDPEIFTAEKAIQQKVAKWLQQDTWKTESGTRLVMIVEKDMSIIYDNEGRWSIYYAAQVYVNTHTWVYTLNARSKNQTPLFSLVLPTETCSNGPHYIRRTGVSPDIRRDFEMISYFERSGRGSFRD